VGIVREVLEQDPQRRAIGVVGGTGGGKTHFLRHCQHLMRGFGESGRKPFVIAEVLAGSSSAVQLLQQVFREADETAKLHGEYDLLTAIIRSAQQEEDFDSIRQPELRGVLQLLFRATQTGFVPPDRDRQMSFEPLRDLTKKWLNGASLSPSEKRYLGVFSRLGSAAMMTRLLSELFSVARKTNILEGVMLCLDELETLFSGSLSSPRIQGFLQDVRYFFDEAIRGKDGYSLLLLSASTPLGTANLRDYSYPLYQRLGFEEGSRAELSSIASVEEVKGISEIYIEHELRRAKLEKKKFPAILTASELEEAYRSAATTDRAAQTAPVQRVNQGQLLQALHNIVERKRVEASLPSGSLRAK
jgi:hypothetical protein